MLVAAAKISEAHTNLCDELTKQLHTTRLSAWPHSASLSLRSFSADPPPDAELSRCATNEMHVAPDRLVRVLTYLKAQPAGCRLAGLTIDNALLIRATYAILSAVAVLLLKRFG